MCPVDSTVLSKEKTFPDRFCNRNLMALECFCSGKAEGCCWKGAFEFLEVGEKRQQETLNLKFLRLKSFSRNKLGICYRINKTNVTTICHSGYEGHMKEK